jgi:O-antigen/teichoic acid export membrane protein
MDFMATNSTRNYSDDKLLKHGSIIFFATAISFFFAYVFHFYMARALGPESYGILGSMLSLLYIFSVPSSVITTMLTQIVSEQTQNTGKIKSILILSSNKLVYIGLAIFIALLLLSPLLKNMLNLPSGIPVMILGFSLIFTTALPSPRGVLQGMQNFSSLGFNMAIEKPALLFFGALFVYLGLGVNGALLSFGIASIVVLAMAFIPLRGILENDMEEVNLSVHKYAYPIFILIFCITVLSSIDILFVRRYFPAEVSGQFTAMKMLGQVIYFSAIALGGVLLPKVSKMNLASTAHRFLLRKALLYFGLLLAAVLGTYALAPEFIITFLYGKDYSAISVYLVWYAITMGLLSLAIIFMFYNVSAKRTAFRYPLVALTLLQSLLLMVFHESVGQIIIVQGAVFLMLLMSVVGIDRRYKDLHA